MIEPLMRGGKGFIGKIRDGLGIAAGDEAVGRVREQRTVHGVYQQLVRVGKRTLHLVEHNAGSRQNAAPQLIMPALLLEDLRLFVDAGNVSAFRNVFKEPFISSTNGSLTGNCFEPHRTECSRM